LQWLLISVIASGAGNSVEKAGWWPGDSATLDDGQGVSK
jgi:hypothetical protein